MPDLTTTPGSASANAFASLDEAEVYCDARSNGAAWAAETDDDVKARVLIDATRDLTVLMYNGQPRTDTQALAWPRQWAVNPSASLSGTYFDASVIPQRIKDATCELALQYLKAGTTDLAALDATTGIKEKTVDVLTTVYQDNWQRPSGLKRFPRVWDLVKPLLCGSSTTVPLVRG